jgi:hypothetical protein
MAAIDEAHISAVPRVLKADWPQVSVNGWISLSARLASA